MREEDASRLTEEGAAGSGRNACRKRTESGSKGDVGPYNRDKMRPYEAYHSQRDRISSLDFRPTQLPFGQRARVLKRV